MHIVMITYFSSVVCHTLIPVGEHRQFNVVRALQKRRGLVSLTTNPPPSLAVC